MSAHEIQRHRTALSRRELSRPFKLAIRDGLLSSRSSVFDYGCGRGDDLRSLQSQGFECAGWDPAHRPDASKRAADVVNLGYVVNVIESPAERADVLKSSWDLTRSLLIVAAQRSGDSRSDNLRPHGDGFLTGANTFQKYWEQDELRDWIEEILQTACVPAAPGVFYVFKREAEREAFAATRFRRRIAAPRVRHSEKLFEQNRADLDALMNFFAERGRLPQTGELPESPALERTFGSLKRAFSIVRRVTGSEQWDRIAQERHDDLLVYIALARFRRRPKFSALPADLQADIRALFGSYKAATDLGDALLFSLGRQDAIDEACRVSCVGTLMPTALYVHESAVPSLSVLLRVYEGAARAYVGDVEDTNVIKLARDKAKVSYLAYPNFEVVPHPTLALSLSVSLSRFRIWERSFYHHSNPPILHRKERLVQSDHPLRRRFERLTAQEERRGLYDQPERIGTLHGWEAKLAECGVRLRGHRVVTSDTS